MRLRDLLIFIQLTGISYSLIALLFAVMSLVTPDIGPSGAYPLLLLFFMCAIIAAWCSWLRPRFTNAPLFYYLLCYVVCISTVLGLGAATGFIPLWIWNPGHEGITITVVAMITAVFAGTSLFSVIMVKSDESRINARLAVLRSAAPAEDVRGDEQPPARRTAARNRYLTMLMCSYMTVLVASVCIDAWELGLRCSDWYVISVFGVCAATCAAAFVLERALGSPWLSYCLQTAAGAAIAAAVLIPAGFIGSSAVQIAAIFGGSAVSCAATRAILYGWDRVDALQINEEIEERRSDGRNHRS